MSTIDVGEATEFTLRPHDSFKIPVKSGLKQEREIEIKVGSSATAIFEVFAAEWGVGIEELLIVREGDSAVLAAEFILDVNYPHHRRHHVHRHHDVTVTVYYQGSSHQHNFKRSSTVDDVLMWTIKAFNIDAAMAPEFELALHGTTEELPDAEHIGHLAGCHHELALDVIRGDIANGGNDDR